MKPLLSFILYFLLASSFILAFTTIIIASTLPSNLNTPTIIQLNYDLNLLKISSESILLQMNQINSTDYDKSQNPCNYNLTELNQTAYQLLQELLVFGTSVNISYNVSFPSHTGQINTYLSSSYLVESNVTFNFSVNSLQFDSSSELLYLNLFPTGETEFFAETQNYTQIRLNGLNFNCRFCNGSFPVFTAERISTAPHVAGFSQLLYNNSDLYLRDGLMYVGDVLALQDDFFIY